MKKYILKLLVLLFIASNFVSTDFSLPFCELSISNELYAGVGGEKGPTDPADRGKGKKKGHDKDKVPKQPPVIPEIPGMGMLLSALGIFGIAYFISKKWKKS